MQINSVTNRSMTTALCTRVLVVEDEFLIRMLVSDHLREMGYNVVEACNGDEAVTVLKSGILIDLVYTDVRMPGATDGLALLAFVKRTQPDTPVVMTSGHLSPGLALAGGASHFLSKPCDLDSITAAIDEALLQAS